VFYGAAASEAIGMTGQRVCVIGGANSAGQAALHVAKYASHVSVLIRGDSIAAGMSDYLVRQIEAAPNIDIRTRTRVIDGDGGDRLQSLVLEDIGNGTRERIEAAAAFVMIGASPRTDWLEPVERDADGSIRTGAHAGGGAGSRAPMLLETSVPGVFAVGDVRSGSVKRVASAVGDGGVVIGQVHRYLALLEEQAARVP
jgi:thioredoxin reductase (NADPH)